MSFGPILAIIASGILLYIIFRYIKNNPDAFSAVNLTKSTYTMGMLALILIAFVGMCIFVLKMG